MQSGRKRMQLSETLIKPCKRQLLREYLKVDRMVIPHAGLPISSREGYLYLPPPNTMPAMPLTPATPANSVVPLRSGLKLQAVDPYTRSSRCVSYGDIANVHPLGTQSIVSPCGPSAGKCRSSAAIRTSMPGARSRSASATH